MSSMQRRLLAAGLVALLAVGGFWYTEKGSKSSTRESKACTGACSARANKKSKRMFCNYMMVWHKMT